MAVYYNGSKMLDVKVIGFDANRVYTKEEVDAKFNEIQAITSDELNSLFSGSIIVTARTGDSGQMQSPGEYIYTASGEANIGMGWSKVTISGSGNEVTYDPNTGIAKFKIYHSAPNFQVSATISYS